MLVNVPGPVELLAGYTQYRELSGVEQIVGFVSRVIRFLADSGECFLAFSGQLLRIKTLYVD